MIFNRIHINVAQIQMKQTEIHTNTYNLYSSLENKDPLIQKIFELNSE